MRLKKLTLTAVLTAAALVMFVLESQLPPLTAIPGIKPNKRACKYWPLPVSVFRGPYNGSPASG